MSQDLSVAQLLIVRDRHGFREPEVIAASPEVSAAAESAALSIVKRYGVPATGIRCPRAIFAWPLSRRQVVLGQVSDEPAGHPDPARLFFWLLLLDRQCYETVNDPFLIADRFPPAWHERGMLPTLNLSGEARPARSVAEIQAILRDGDSAWLLGAAQALVDGGRVLWESDTPATEVIRGVWQLLPERSRMRLWPATFAFSPELSFHVLAMPSPIQPWPPSYLHPEQARDYPESYYELALQTAVEAGHQAELDRLFSRRSADDTLQLAAILLLTMLLVAIASHWLV
jgi:hypothetical protein